MFLEHEMHGTVKRHLPFSDRLPKGTWIQRFRQRQPVVIRKLLGTSRRCDNPLENASQLLAAMLKRLLREMTEQTNHLRIHRIVAVMPHELHNGRANLRTRPETARRHLADNRDIVMELNPHPCQTTRFRALFRRQPFRNLRLDKNGHHLW